MKRQDLWKETNDIDIQHGVVDKVMDVDLRELGLNPTQPWKLTVP